MAWTVTQLKRAGWTLLLWVDVNTGPKALDIHSQHHQYCCITLSYDVKWGSQMDLKSLLKTIQQFLFCMCICSTFCSGHQTNSIVWTSVPKNAMKLDSRQCSIKPYIIQQGITAKRTKLYSSVWPSITNICLPRAETFYILFLNVFFFFH